MSIVLLYFSTLTLLVGYPEAHLTYKVAIMLRGFE